MGGNEAKPHRPHAVLIVSQHVSAETLQADRRTQTLLAGSRRLCCSPVPTLMRLVVYGPRDEHSGLRLTKAKHSAFFSTSSLLLSFGSPLTSCTADLSISSQRGVSELCDCPSPLGRFLSARRDEWRRGAGGGASLGRQNIVQHR